MKDAKQYLSRNKALNVYFYLEGVTALGFVALPLYDVTISVQLPFFPLKEGKPE